jgi:hypothetical protein
MCKATSSRNFIVLKTVLIILRYIDDDSFLIKSNNSIPISIIPYNAKNVIAINFSFEVIFYLYFNIN